MWDIIADYTGDPGVVATVVVALVGGLVAWGRLSHQRLDREIADPASRPVLIDRWRQGWHGAYLGQIRAVARFADALYGPKLFSWRAFFRSLQLAYLYPIFAALLAWVLVNQHSPAGLELFSDDPLWWRRLARAAALLVAIAIAVRILSRAERIGQFVVDRVFPGLDIPTARAGFLPKAARAVGETVAVAVTGAGAGAGAGAVAVTVTGAVAVAVTVAGAVAVAVAVAGAFAGAVILFTEGPEAGYLVLFFYILLPLLNAVADFVSVRITRGFLAHYTEGPAALPGLPGILGRALVDLLLAAACLGALLAALHYSLTLWEAVSPATLPLSPTAYLAEVRADPWQGFALYFMVATTLLPTAIHAIVGFGAMITHRGRLLAAQADILEGYAHAPDGLSVIHRGDMVRRVWWAVFRGRLLAAVPVLALCGLVMYPVVELTTG